MKQRTFIALLGGAALTLALSFGCRDDGRTNPPAAQQSSRGVSPTTGNRQLIATSEPDSYSATLRLMAEPLGEHTTAFPNIEADVARRGRDRRVSFRLPDGEQVVYLSHGGKRYVILPERGQYADVSPYAASFELPRLLTPEQLVDYLKGQRGYVRKGEEELYGRTVVKYVAADDARTSPQASVENIVYVDKLTELPLRAELVSEVEGDVRSVRVVRVVTEIRNVRAEADPDLFARPRGLEKVKAEEVRRQVDSLVNTATGIAGSLLDQMSVALDADASAARARGLR